MQEIEVIWLRPYCCTSFSTDRHRYKHTNTRTRARTRICACMYVFLICIYIHRYTCMCMCLCVCMWVRTACTFVDVHKVWSNWNWLSIRARNNGKCSIYTVIYIRLHNVFSYILLIRRLIYRNFSRSLTFYQVRVYTNMLNMYSAHAHTYMRTPIHIHIGTITPTKHIFTYTNIKTNNIKLE